MYAPAYSNLMDINSTIKGTMQELLTKQQQQTPTNISGNPVNTPLNTLEKKINPLIR
jgi:hypothetical protein